MAKTSRFRSKQGSAKEEMAKRTEESQSRAGGTNKWNDYLKEDFQGSKFTAKDGDHLIDIIPYLTGDNDPKLGPDERAYMVDVYVHQKVGINEDSILCPSSNYRGKKCPICEHQAKMKQSKKFTDDQIKELSPKRRVLYNVVCYDSVEEENKGVQVWEASYHLTENEILAIARNRRSGGFIPFADPDDGKSISFYREGKGASTRYKGYQFVEREEVISDEILEDAYCLDELLDIKSYDEILEIFAPTAPDIDGVPRSARGKSHDEEDDEEDEKPRKASRARKTSGRKEEEEEPPFDEDDEIPNFKRGEEEDEEDEEEEEAKPVVSRRRRRG